MADPNETYEAPEVEELDVTQGPVETAPGGSNARHG